MADGRETPPTCADPGQPPYSEPVLPTYMDALLTPYSEPTPPSYTESERPDPNRPENGSQHVQVIVVPGTPLVPPLGPEPTEVTCPSCRIVVYTNVLSEPSPAAYRYGMLLFIFGCLICSCVPFLMDRLKNYKHSCPICSAYIGTYQPRYETVDTNDTPDTNNTPDA